MPRGSPHRDSWGCRVSLVPTAAGITSGMSLNCTEFLAMCKSRAFSVTSPTLWLIPNLNTSLSLIHTHLLLRARCSSKVFLAIETSQAPNSCQKNSLIILNSTDDKGGGFESRAITWSRTCSFWCLPEVPRSPYLRKQITLISFIIVIINVPSKTPSGICFGLFLIFLKELDFSPRPSLN